MLKAVAGRVQTWLVAGLASLVCLGAQAAVPADDPQYAVTFPITVGSSFSLFMDASAGLVMPADGFIGTDLFMGYDATALTLTGVSVGGLFGPDASLSAPAPSVIPGYESLTSAYYVVTRTSPAAAVDGGVFQFDFNVIAMPTAGITQILLTGIDDPLITALPDYYAFNGSFVEVTVVPEPATMALLWAGLGLVAGTAARRRQALSA